MPTTKILVIPDFDKSVLSQETVNNELIIVNTYSLKGNTVFVSKNFIKKMPDGNNVIYRVESTNYTE